MRIRDMVVCSVVATTLGLGCGDDDSDGDGDDGSEVTEDGGTSPGMDSGMTGSTDDEDAGATSADAGPTVSEEDDQANCVPEPDDAGAQCNTIEVTAEAVTIEAGEGEVPVGTGGRIAAGRYALTSAVAYPGSALPVGVAIAQNLEICGGVVQIGQLIAGFDEHKTATLDPTGTDPNLSEVCTTDNPDDTDWTSYSANATSFVLYSDSLDAVLSFTLE